MFYRNNQAEEKKPIYEDRMVDVWQCPNCIGWMQKEFALSNEPLCPFCTTGMTEGQKTIRILI